LESQRSEALDTDTKATLPIGKMEMKAERAKDWKKKGRNELTK